jgi:hypothetical protein
MYKRKGNSPSREFLFSQENPNNNNYNKTSINNKNTESLDYYPFNSHRNPLTDLND